ncbi:MAG: CDP-diacylglycerol--serine O-phosphatidyltransferase [Bacteroidales bacterium]|jgi:CDP-diacylglycerol--serine O-phosphatidyltransferase
MQKPLYKNIPNFITILNLLSGIIGILFVLKFDNIKLGCLMVLISGFFDLFDGLSARLLNAKSKIGLELDSLADVVSFGVLPGFLIYSSITSLNLANNISQYLAYLSFLFPAFAALRLAKFNTQEQQLDVFNGLSAPGATFLVISILLNESLTNFFSNHQIFALIFLISLTILLSALMVSNIKFLSLKFDSFSIRKNLITYILILFSIISLTILKLDGLVYIFIFYFIISFFNLKIKKQNIS